MKRSDTSIKTERLWLRQIDETDAESIVSLRSDESVYRYFLNPVKLSLNSHRSWYKEQYINSNDRIDWIAVDNATGEFIGIYGAKRDSSDTVEVSYITNPNAQHKGYAKEAIEAIMDWCKRQWWTTHFFASIHYANDASQDFIRNLGFEQSRDKLDSPMYLYRKELIGKMFKTAIVHSVAEYMEVLSHIPAEYIWFRGQSDASYRLMPSAMRNAYAIEDQRGNRFSRPFPERGDSGSSNMVAFLPVNKMVEEFKEQAKECISYPVANNLEWECIGQHYGLPTSLLDWTTNPLDALYFATCDCEIGETTREGLAEFWNYGLSGAGGAIFIIDPIEVNRCSIFAGVLDKSRVADLVFDYEGLKNHLDSILPPICVAGMNKKKRICRQSGNFTLHNKVLWPMDYYQVLQEQMYKILVPYDCFVDIRKELSLLNITHEAIYVEDDEKDLIAREIAEKTKEKFMTNSRSSLMTC